MRREDLPANESATFVLPDWKTVYVSVPKAACTSMKWVLADLQQEDPERFHRAVSGEVSRAMTIHHRRLWQHTPMLHRLTDEQLAEITPENGWFVFGVVRHPASRLWSGWQSKYLLKEPHFKLLPYQAPWPRVPESTSDVVEDFVEFVRHLRDFPKGEVLHDRHFRPQHRLLRCSTMTYSHVYRTDEIGELMKDLEEHLRPLGLDTMPQLRRSNEAPLLPIAPMFPAEVTDIVADLYAQDLRTFGWTSAQPPKLSPATEYPDEAIAEIGRLVERGERIGDLYDLASRSRAAHKETRSKLLELRKEHRRTLRQLERLRRARSRPKPAPAPPSLRQRVRGAAGRVLRRGR